MWVMMSKLNLLKMDNVQKHTVQFHKMTQLLCIVLVYEIEMQLSN